MLWLMFTKHLKGLSIDQMAAGVKDLGLGGLDLPVREGFPVTPENARQTFPEATRICRDHGMSIGTVTCEGFWTSADAPGLEDLLEVMAECGCHLIKPGYWRFREEDDYWATVAKIRKDLDGLATLAEKHAVTWLVHTHSGMNYGSTCAALLHLIKEYDPDRVGAYIDFGHLAINGEELPMAVAMVKDRLRAVAVKDLCYLPVYGPGHRRWRRQVVPLSDGLVDWSQAMGLLKQMGYGGPLILHSEYDLPPEEVLAWTAHDMAYLQEVMAELT